MDTSFVKTLGSHQTFEYKFSVCTMVSKPAEYEEMLASFLSGGFDTQSTEYLIIDNSEGNVFDAYSGLNYFLRLAKGQFIILCHQDIVLHDHIATDLEARITEMNAMDVKWAVLSNAGGINLKHLAMHLTQKSGFKLHENILPLRAQSVDENFMVVKNTANLALSSNLSGFHLYGTDICIVADFLGYRSYVIDFQLTHKSNGTVDHRFYSSRKALMKKYRLAFRGRFLSTTITRVYLSGNWWSYHLLNLQPIMFLMRQYYKFLRRKSEYQPRKD